MKKKRSKIEDEIFYRPNTNTTLLISSVLLLLCNTLLEIRFSKQSRENQYYTLFGKDFTLQEKPILAS